MTSLATQEMCGVRMQFFAFSNGLSLLMGSCADHIQPRCINLSTIQRISQIPLHDQSPAAVVDQDHAILYLGTILSVDDIDYLEPRIDVGKNGKMQL